MARPQVGTGAVHLPPRQISLPVIALLGYAALFVTGFGTYLGAFQPVPMYAYFSLLLLVLQMAISENHTIARAAYVVLTSIFAIVYAGEVVFNRSPENFTRNPYTYIVLNILLVLVFVYGAVDRRRKVPGGLQAALPHLKRMPAVSATRLAPMSYAAFGVDFVGLAILFFIAAFLLDLLGLHIVPSFFNFAPRPSYVIVDLNATLGVSLASPLNYLESLDLTIALAASGVALLLLGIVGVLAAGGMRGMPASSESSTGVRAVRSFGGSLWRILSMSSDEVLLSLRLVLGPIFWLIPAFSIAIFSQQFTAYLNRVAQSPGRSILDLFNPVSPNSRAGYGQGLGDFALAVAAVAAVLLTVAVVEHDLAIIGHTLRIFRVAGRTVALTLAFFIYSLAAFNAVAVLVRITRLEPFQVGAAGALALLAAIGIAAYTAVHQQMMRARKPPRSSRS
jgi:uncharacterized membrane protein